MLLPTITMITAAISKKTAATTASTGATAASAITDMFYAKTQDEVTEEMTD